MKKDPRKYVKYFLYFFEILLDANIAALCFDNSLISSIKDILIKWNMTKSPIKDPIPAISPRNNIFLLIEKIKIIAVAIGAVKENTYRIPAINIPMDPYSIKLSGMELLNPPNKNIVSAYITPRDLNFLYFKLSLIAYFFGYRFFKCW